MQDGRGRRSNTPRLQILQNVQVSAETWRGERASLTTAGCSWTSRNGEALQRRVALLRQRGCGRGMRDVIDLHDQQVSEGKYAIRAAAESVLESSLDESCVSQITEPPTTVCYC